MDLIVNFYKKFQNFKIPIKSKQRSGEGGGKEEGRNEGRFLI